MNIDYDYKRIIVPIELVNRANVLMCKIGCRTMTSFLSIGMTDYMDRLEKKNEDDSSKENIQ